MYRPDQFLTKQQRIHNAHQYLAKQLRKSFRFSQRASDRMLAAEFVVVQGPCSSFHRRGYKAYMGQLDTNKTGTVINGKYRILGPLGQGAWGVVHRVEDIKKGKALALKMLKVNVADDESRERFAREALALTLLRHNNIVAAHDYGVWNGSPYFTMDYVEGISLFDVIQAEQRIDVDEIARIGVGVCDALRMAHEQGIVHRDLSTRNIILGADGEPKVLDFGLLRMMHTEAMLNTLTQTGMTMGSPWYMSPEQCNGMKVDGRTDIYALGCIFYECATGKPPFDAPVAVALMMQHINEMPTPICDKKADAALATLNKILMRALEKKPEKRYQKAGEMAAEFAALAKVSYSPEKLRRTANVRIAAPLMGAIGTKANLRANPTEEETVGPAPAPTTDGVALTAAPPTVPPVASRFENAVPTPEMLNQKSGLTQREWIFITITAIAVIVFVVLLCAFPVLPEVEPHGNRGARFNR